MATATIVNVQWRKQALDLNQGIFRVQSAFRASDPRVANVLIRAMHDLGEELTAPLDFVGLANGLLPDGDWGPKAQAAYEWLQRFAEEASD